MTTAASTYSKNEPITKIYRDLVHRRRSLAWFYLADAMDRVTMIKRGVPAELFLLIVEDMAITRERLCATLGLARATVDRKLRNHTLLNSDESERILGLCRLIGHVDEIVRESGNPAGFDASTWVAAWLLQPHPALGNKLPEEFMDTAEGRDILFTLIAQMQSGAYA